MPSPVSADSSSTCSVGIHLLRMIDAALHVETHIGQQIQLVDQQQVAGPEHVRIFQRLVVAFRNRHHHHPRLLAQVEQRGTNQVADILDQQHRAAWHAQPFDTVRHHMSVEMASGAGVDLHHRGARGPDTVGIGGGRLVAL